MGTNYKVCPIGHYYGEEFEKCPYCERVGARNRNPQNSSFRPTEEEKTNLFSEQGAPTQKGTIINGGHTVFGVQGAAVRGASGTANKNTEGETLGPWNLMPGRQGVGTAYEPSPFPAPSSGPRLVGWLVSFTLDSRGVDFKVYEGRNTIGRDASCSIRATSDMAVSGKHASLLVRNGVNYLTDLDSINGTYVNDEDIEDNKYHLKDGDVVKVGNTVFVFRTCEPE